MPDFDFKDKFPISQYIQGVLEKRRIEEASAQEGRRALLEGLQSIGNVAQGVADERATTARALSQAALLAQNKPEMLDAFGASKPVATRRGPLADIPLPPGQIGPMNQASTQIPVTFGETESGRKNVMNSLANAIKGISGNELLNQIKPDAVLYPVIKTNRQTGEQAIEYIKGQKGAKPTTTSFGTTTGTVGGMKDDRQRQMAAMRLKDAANKEINSILGGEQQIGSMSRIYDELAASNVAGEGYLTGLSEVGSKLSFGKYEPKIKAYNDIRKGMLARLKGITGDTGVLTETDAQRIIELLPDLKDSVETKNIKMAEIGAVLEAARQRRMKSTNTLMQEIQSGNNIAPLSSDGSGGMTPAELAELAALEKELGGL